MRRGGALELDMASINSLLTSSLGDSGNKVPRRTALAMPVPREMPLFLKLHQAKLSFPPRALRSSPPLFPSPGPCPLPSTPVEPTSLGARDQSARLPACHESVALASLASSAPLLLRRSDRISLSATRRHVESSVSLEPAHKITYRKAFQSLPQPNLESD
jgi:hypothetical protein